MSFQSQFADYKPHCTLPKLNNPMRVPFMNSIASPNMNNPHIVSTQQVSSSGNENKYYINNFTDKEYFTNKKEVEQKKVTNDFALAWTCVQRDDGSHYCPLRGDTY